MSQEIGCKPSSQVTASRNKENTRLLRLHIVINFGLQYGVLPHSKFACDSVLSHSKHNGPFFGMEVTVN